MCGSALSRQRFCQNLLVEPIGFSYPATQIYRLTARLKFRLGILIKKRGGALSLSSMR